MSCGFSELSSIGFSFLLYIANLDRWNFSFLLHSAVVCNTSEKIFSLMKLLWTQCGVTANSTEGATLKTADTGTYTQNFVL